MSLLGVCLALAATLERPVFLPVQSFTLAWVHSIERSRWEEDYAIETGRDGQPVLRALQARIKGSAAGMEPPDDARWVDGWYAYTPRQQHPAWLPLSRSPYTADYEWCAGGACTPLSSVLPSDGGITLVWPCRQGATEAPPGAGLTRPRASGSSG